MSDGKNRRFANDAQDHPGPVVGFADRVAIHGRRVKRWLCHPRDGGLGQNPARCRPQANSFRVRWPRQRKHPRQRLFNRDHASAS